MPASAPSWPEIPKSKRTILAREPNPTDIFRRLHGRISFRFLVVAFSLPHFPCTFTKEVEMKRLISVVGAMGLALSAAFSPAAAQEVKLGVVMSNTGTYAFVGTAVINAVRLAFDEMQAKN